MKTLSVVLKDLLVAEQLAYYIGDDPQNPNDLDWACVVAREIDINAPTDLIAIIDTGGTSPRYALTRTLSPVRYPTAIIRVRTDGFEESYAKAKELADFFAERTRFSSDGATYGVLKINGDIVGMGWDVKHRYVHSFNVWAVCQ